MTGKLFKFLETNKVVLNDELKNAITESFNIAVKEKSDKLETEITKLKAENSDVKGVLKEAATEIKALRTSKTEEVKKAVKLYETKMVDKLSKYLDYKINEVMPTTLVEAQAKLEVLEPLVEAVKFAFETQGIKLDGKGFDILKEAKKEIKTLESKLDGEIKKNLQLEEATEKVLGKYLLKEKTEGLTPAQKKQINKIFEGVSYEEIEKRFDSVRNLVITEEVKKDDEVDPAKKIVEEYSPEADKVNDADDWGAKYLNPRA